MRKIKKLLKEVAKLKKYLLYMQIFIRNFSEKERIVAGGEGPVVSLATHGSRYKTVHIAIESIARGTLKPAKIILWIDEDNPFNNPSPGVRRLMDRGLEVRKCDNDGPHKKYYPYLLSCKEFNNPMVTADDDVFYPKDWLKNLYQAYLGNSDVINCHYLYRITLTREGVIEPYRNWQSGGLAACNPSYLNFPIGVGGIIYPTSFLRHLKSAGHKFRDCCPTASDIWLHVNAVRSGFRARQIAHTSPPLTAIPDTHKTALTRINLAQNKNNEYIQQIYTPQDIAILQAAT